MFFRRRDKAAIELSSYIDNELDDEESMEIGERLIFDDRYMRLHDDYVRTSSLASAALSPSEIPKAEDCAKRVLRLIAANADDSLQVSAVDSEPAASPGRGRGRVLLPAVIASVGIFVTAGATFAGLRRRGLI